MPQRRPTRFIFPTKKILSAIYKDHVPTNQQSMVVLSTPVPLRLPVRGPNSLRLLDRNNQHIPKSIRNNQNPTKLLPKRNCKEKSINSSFHNVTQQLDSIFYKTKSAPTITMTRPANNYNPCQGKKCIPSFSIGSHHLHQNSQTNSVSPEKIRLLFTNFPQSSVSQYNANSTAIYQYKLPFLPFYRFLCISDLTS